MKQPKQITLIAIAGALCLITGPAAASEWNAGGDGTSWEDANNWSTAEPGFGDLARINRAGGSTVIVTQNGEQADRFIIGQGQLGGQLLTISSGSLTTDSSTNHRIGQTSQGNINISGGLLNVQNANITSAVAGSGLTATGGTVLIGNSATTRVYDLSNNSFLSVSGDAMVNITRNLLLGVGSTGSVADTATLVLGNRLDLETSTSSFSLDGGTLKANRVFNANGGTFNWGDGTLTTSSNGAEGGTDFSDPAGAASGSTVRGGTILTVTGNLATGVGDTSDLDLGNLFINGGVRQNVMTVAGDLNLSASGDTLSALRGAYLLRPNTGTVVDFGEIPLITVGGNLTGEFDTFVAPGNDNLGFYEYTGAWTPGTSAASDLPLNTWYLEYDETADTVSFFYKVEGSVPEPGTMGLLAMGLLIARGMRKNEDPDWA